jgi:hypothetical protein
MVMPGPGTKEAPKFDDAKPSELLRFFERLEDLFTTNNVGEPADKKKWAGRYTSAETEREWRAFREYTQGSWDEFKKEVIKSYPEAADLERGSVERLERVCKKRKGLDLIASGELAQLLSLKRAFTAEAEKLLIEPTVVSNRELVAKFYACLTPNFRMAVEHRLLNKTVPAVGNANARPEDMFTWREVMTAAVELATIGVAQPYEHVKDQALGVHSKSHLQEPSIKEEEMAEFLDTMRVQQKFLMSEAKRQAERDLARDQKMDQYFKAAQAIQPVYNSQPQYPRQTSYNFQNNANNNSGNSGCFYCGKTTCRIATCEEAARHLNAGWIKRVDNKLRLADGSPLPFDMRKATSLLVEDLHRKPGIIPMAKINIQSQSFDGESSQLSGNYSDPATARLITGFAQMIGKENFARIMERISSDNPLEGIEEDDERLQNF